jgi:putative phage-type endonuclease
MNREIIPFTTQEKWLNDRAVDVTSTEIAALFGISPYLTKYEIWHRKHNKDLGQFELNERMKWGSRLQDSIAAGVAEDNGWTIRKMTEYIRLTDLNAGSSFDFAIGEVNAPYHAVLEIKNVDGLAFKEGWLVDGDNVEAPPHIELQVQYQMWVAGVSHATIAALVGGNRVVLINREADKEVQQKIEKVLSDFWESIALNKEPEPDFKRDAEFVASLYKKAVKDSEIFADDEVSVMAREYKRWGDVEKKAKETKAEYKAKILIKVGTASKVVGEEFSIALGETKGSSYMVERKPGRNFRIYFKGEAIND